MFNNKLKEMFATDFLNKGSPKTHSKQCGYECVILSTATRQMN